MLEMLKERKAALKAEGKKGFTLMEMLIVIAIIAILIAIAIPLFTSQLNAARVATDEANIRSGYAVATATVLSDNIKTDTTWTLQADASISETASSGYTTQGNNDAQVTIGSTSGLTWSAGQTVTYTYTASSNTVTISISS